MIGNDSHYCFILYNLDFFFVFKALTHLYVKWVYMYVRMCEHTGVSRSEPPKYALLISDMSGHIQQSGGKSHTRKMSFYMEVQVVS